MKFLGWILAFVLMLGLAGSSSAAVIRFQETFSTAGSLNAWTTVNNSTPPGTGWQVGPASLLVSRTNDLAFAAVSMDAVGTRVNGLPSPAPASAWLISPAMTLQSGDVLSFWTIGEWFSDSAFADRMQVRLNVTNSGTNVGSTPTSVGDFTTLLLDINPTLQVHPDPGAYPIAWTNYQLTIPTGVNIASGRFAFRYMFDDVDTQGYEIGVDDVQLIAVPEPSVTALAAVGIGGVLMRRRRVGPQSRPMQHAAFVSRHGFTLVEVLVSIAIIALMAALILPGLARVRAAARATECQVNVANLAKGLRAYAANNAGCLPPTNTGYHGYWHLLVAKDVGATPGPQPSEAGGGSFVCPEDDQARRSYAMNFWASCDIDAYRQRTVGQNLWRLGDLRSPEQFMLVIEANSYFGATWLGFHASPSVGLEGTTAGNRFGGGGGLAPPLNAGRVGRINTELCFSRHRGYAAVAFADNHVGWYQQQDLVDMQSGRSTGIAKWYPKEQP